MTPTYPTHTFFVLSALLLGAGACTPPRGDLGDYSESDSEAATSEDAEEALCVPDEPLDYGRYRCGEGGHEHQREPALCQLAAANPCTTPGEGSTCSEDADCGGGTCEQREDVDLGVFCECLPPSCEATEDCAAGTSCYCTWNGSGRCMPSNCATDEDCGGAVCAVSQDACGVHGLFCTTPEDLCDGEFGCIYVAENARWEEVGAVGCP
ncbi:hypothetical protein SAMN02745121_01178 [Nannocystis exedens]|uniref:Uncharacterized protein n=1 Tax=Nannocystis exedens TaxID=54 RepID=A0A1I1UJT0_9BACT|nr:hypothetical protein [Nannocystis exedens]PCC71635.1 hypothetical protein NAEX_04712 [Nannocystis exedens]SFD69013.1 hypothetical protein SAMN02745121_01178 [Nannocystis exedens]